MSNSDSKRRNQIVLPLVLIVLGVLVLAANLGWLSWGRVWDVLNLWPVLLIAVGVDLLTAGRYRWIVAVLTIVVVALAMTGRVPFLNGAAGPAAQTHDVQIPLEGADRAEVTIRVGVSELSISSLGEGNQLVAGTVRTAEGETFTQDIQREGDTAVVTLAAEQRGIGGMQGNVDRTWDLGLAAGIPTELSISTGVGRSRLDLRELILTELSVNAGVGEMTTTLPLPSEGSYQASFDTGVGETTVRVPEGAAVRVEVDRGLGSITARGGFDALGDNTYETPDYAEAEERIDISIEGGVGSITIERIR